MPWDGNCAFAAIAAGFNSRDSFTHETLRASVVNYIPTSNLGLFFTALDRVELATPNTAVGQQAIVAAANVLHVNIHIHSIDGSIIPIESSDIATGDIHLGYTGRHYFLLLPHHQEVDSLTTSMAGLHINPDSLV